MGDFKATTKFRGFEKLPVVLIQRIDIEPYVNMKRRRPSSPSTAPHAQTDTSLDDITIKHQLLRDCSVKLFRDDLDKIKMSLIEKPFVTCRICKKNYSDLKKLRNHQGAKHKILYQPKVVKRVSFSNHVTVHELKEYHKCHRCSRIYEDIKCLKLHMRKDHKKRGCYICYYCNKSFVDRSLFKVHIKLHCDVCRELFPTKATYVMHRKNVCKVKRQYKCKTCQLSFFQFMDLKEHSYEHFSTYFICDICKDQLSTRCAVSHHLTFLHSDNKPESLYECQNPDGACLYSCNFCEETSVEKNDLENHVSSLPDLSNRTMTSYEDFYFCKECLSKFGTEEELFRHTLTHIIKPEQNNVDTSSDDVQKPDDEVVTEVNLESRDEPTISHVENKIDNIYSTFDTKNKVPNNMLPVIVLKNISPNKADIVKRRKVRAMYISSVDINNLSNSDYDGLLQKSKGKPIVDPKSKKTLLSRHQCKHCFKYLSSNNSLRRHLKAYHPTINTSLRCADCEEYFFWPALLLSHNCIRRHNLPEMDFQDARPEILFENPNFCNIPQETDIDEYSEDFEIPPPIVELTEYDCSYVPGVNYGIFNNVKDKVEVPNGYRLVMEEIPVEF